LPPICVAGAGGGRRGRVDWPRGGRRRRGMVLTLYGVFPYHCVTRAGGVWRDRDGWPYGGCCRRRTLPTVHGVIPRDFAACAGEARRGRADRPHSRRGRRRRVFTVYGVVPCRFIANGGRQSWNREMRSRRSLTAQQVLPSGTRGQRALAPDRSCRRRAGVAGEVHDTFCIRFRGPSQSQAHTKRLND
jgi:hypothetical protein